MSKHFKNQASKRRRDGYHRRDITGTDRLANKISQQSAEIARLKSENSSLQCDNKRLSGKVREGISAFTQQQIIHDSIVKELGKKLNKIVYYRNTYRLLFWSLFTIHSVIVVIKIAVSYFIH